ARRGRGATPAAVGLLPLFPVDRARLRGRGRGAVRDPDGRGALGPGSALPGVGARGALRRERGGGDLRLEAGVRDGRAVPARAAAELGSSALGRAVTEDAIEIRALADDDLEAVVALSLRAWAPVFASVRDELG